MKKYKTCKLMMFCFAIVLLTAALTGCIPSLMINANYFKDKIEYMTYEIKKDEDDVPTLKTESGKMNLELIQDEDERNVTMRQYYLITFNPLKEFEDYDIYSVVLFLRAEKDCQLSISLWLSPKEFLEKEIYLKAQTMDSIEWRISDWKEKYDGSPIMFTLNNPFAVGDTKWSFDNVMFCALENA